MKNCKGIVFPRIVEEIVDQQELLSVWNISYQQSYRIMHGFKAPNHQQKKQLSEYLGIPIDELFVRVDPDPIPKGYAYTKANTPKNSEIISESDKGV